MHLLMDGAMHPRWTLGTFLRTLCRSGIPHFENNYATRGAPIISRNVLRELSDRAHLNWSHFTHIRKVWPGKLIVNGLLSAPDASTAVNVGAAGLLVSNHGGRQLAGVLAPLHVLPALVPDYPQVLEML